MTRPAPDYDDVPVSFGLATKILNGRLLKELGGAKAALKRLQGDPGTTPAVIEIAERDYEVALAEYERGRRLSDADARIELARAGIELCKR